MRISDWSSDVCSSDLFTVCARARSYALPLWKCRRAARCSAWFVKWPACATRLAATSTQSSNRERKSVVYAKSVSVQQDLGSHRSIEENRSQCTQEHMKLQYTQ